MYSALLFLRLPSRRDCGVAGCGSAKGRVRARRGRESVAAINFNESFEQESRSHIHSLTQCSGLVHAQPPPSLLHLLDGGLLVVAILCDVAICARSLARSQARLLIGGFSSMAPPPSFATGKDVGWANFAAIMSTWRRGRRRSGKLLAILHGQECGVLGDGARSH